MGGKKKESNGCGAYASVHMDVTKPENMKRMRKVGDNGI